MRRLLGTEFEIIDTHNTQQQIICKLIVCHTQEISEQSGKYSLEELVPEMMVVSAYKRRSSDNVPNSGLSVPFKEDLGRFLHTQNQQKSIGIIRKD